jgi:hypothetical protein
LTQHLRLLLLVAGRSLQSKAGQVKRLPNAHRALAPTTDWQSGPIENAGLFPVPRIEVHFLVELFDFSKERSQL